MILHLLLEQFQERPVRLQMLLAHVALIQHLALRKFGKVTAHRPVVHGQFCSKIHWSDNRECKQLTPHS